MSADLLAKAGPWKIKMEGERQRYTVMAHNERFFILCKPFNAQNTYLYTIVDLKRGVRGPCNLIFGLPCDVNTTAGAQEALAKIEAGEMEVSFRRYVVLHASEIAALRARAQDTTDAASLSPSSNGEG